MECGWGFGNGDWGLVNQAIRQRGERETNHAGDGGNLEI